MVRMAAIEPWQIAEIPGPKKAAVITKPEAVDAMIKRSKRPVMVIGHLAAEVPASDKKMIDYLASLAKARDIPVIATADTCRELLERGYVPAAVLPAVEAGQRLADSQWKGLDGNGPYDLAIFAGLPYYMAWTILNGLKNFAPHLRTLSLDNKYQPNANFSFANISTGLWLEHMDAVIGHKVG